LEEEKGSLAMMIKEVTVGWMAKAFRDDRGASIHGKEWEGLFRQER